MIEYRAKEVCYSLVLVFQKLRPSDNLENVRPQQNSGERQDGDSRGFPTLRQEINSPELVARERERVVDVRAIVQQMLLVPCPYALKITNYLRICQSGFQLLMLVLL